MPEDHKHGSLTTKSDQGQIFGNFGLCPSHRILLRHVNTQVVYLHISSISKARRLQHLDTPVKGNLYCPSSDSVWLKGFESTSQLLQLSGRLWTRVQAQHPTDQDAL